MPKPNRTAVHIANEINDTLLTLSRLIKEMELVEDDRASKFNFDLMRAGLVTCNAAQEHFPFVDDPV